MFSERIDAKLVDLDTQIAAVKKAAAEQVKALEGQKVALQRLQALLNPNVETAVATLIKMGLIDAI